MPGPQSAVQPASSGGSAASRIDPSTMSPLSRSGGGGSGVGAGTTSPASIAVDASALTEGSSVSSGGTSAFPPPIRHAPNMGSMPNTKSSLAFVCCASPISRSLLRHAAAHGERVYTDAYLLMRSSPFPTLRDHGSSNRTSSISRKYPDRFRNRLDETRFSCLHLQAQGPSGQDVWTVAAKGVVP